MSSWPPDDAELERRIRLKEDNFIERKTSSSQMREIRDTAVAFANSVIAPNYGVIYIGVRDDGSVCAAMAGDQKAPDNVMKKLNECCPPVQAVPRWLKVDGHDVLAILVPESDKPPHFAGPPFVRKGSRTTRACEQLDELLAARNLVLRELRWRTGETVTVKEWQSSQREGDTSHGGFNTHEAKLISVTPHWVVWEIARSSARRSAPARRLELAIDTQHGDRLLIYVHAVPR